MQYLVAPPFRKNRHTMGVFKQKKTKKTLIHQVSSWLGLMDTFCSLQYILIWFDWIKRLILTVLTQPTYLVTKVIKSNLTVLFIFNCCSKYSGMIVQAGLQVFYCNFYIGLYSSLQNRHRPYIYQFWIFFLIAIKESAHEIYQKYP